MKKSFRIDDEYPLIRKTKLLPTSFFFSLLSLGFSLGWMAGLSTSSKVGRFKLFSNMLKVKNLYMLLKRATGIKLYISFQRILHKPFGHGRGEGGLSIFTLLHNPYLVKWSTKGPGRGSKFSK